MEAWVEARMDAHRQADDTAGRRECSHSALGLRGQRAGSGRTVYAAFIPLSGAGSGKGSKKASKSDTEFHQVHTEFHKEDFIGASRRVTKARRCE